MLTVITFIFITYTWDSRLSMLSFSTFSQLTILAAPQTCPAFSCLHGLCPTPPHPCLLAITLAFKTLILPAGCQSPQNPKHILFNLFNKHELSTHCFPGPMLGPVSNINMNKTGFLPHGALDKGPKRQAQLTLNPYQVASDSPPMGSSPQSINILKILPS